VNPHDIFDFDANYVNSFGDFDVAVSGRWGFADMNNQSDDATVWAAGLNLGFSGVTVGGSYGEQNGTKGINMNGEVYDLGISYSTGPWGFSFTYFHGENQGNPEGAALVAETGDEEVDQFLLGISYDLAKGVNIGGYGAYIDFEDADGGTADHSVDGFIIGTGVKIKF
jgi:predicted porin